MQRQRGENRRTESSKRASLITGEVLTAFATQPEGLGLKVLQFWGFLCGACMFSRVCVCVRLCIFSESSYTRLLTPPPAPASVWVKGVRCGVDQEPVQGGVLLPPTSHPSSNTTTVMS